jgi:hypothetical protein
MVITESPIIRSLIDHLFGGFVNFCKINVSSSNDSLDHSSVYETSPRHLNLSSFPYPTTKAFEWSFWVGMKVGILASHMLLSQKPDHKEMQVIHLDQDVQSVWNFSQLS